MKKIQFLFIFFGVIFSCFNSLAVQPERKNAGQPEKINVLVLTERGGQHESFVRAAFQWLTLEKEKLNIEWIEINNTKPVNDLYIKQFELIIQLDFPPYSWTQDAEKAFISYIEEGHGGWIGFHHATLLGEFDGYKMWNWFSEFMGGIRFQNYIAQLADGTVRVEDRSHPVMLGVSAKFTLRADEWYTFNISPRPNVHVLANVDEDSYFPQTDIKMGDHPVVWVNEQKKARNVYFLMGHSNRLFESDDFKTMFANAINWAGNK